MSETMSETTMCWRCNTTYDIATTECPACHATNANADFDKAMAEMEVA